MSDSSSCHRGHFPQVESGFIWTCTVPCKAPPARRRVERANKAQVSGLKCANVKKGAMRRLRGAPQQVSDVSNCAGAKECLISASKATAVANTLTNTNSVTWTTTKGTQVQFTTGLDLLALEETVSSNVNVAWARAVDNSVAVSVTKTLMVSLNSIARVSCEILTDSQPDYRYLRLLSVSRHRRLPHMDAAARLSGNRSYLQWPGPRAAVLHPGYALGWHHAQRHIPSCHGCVGGLWNPAPSDGRSTCICDVVYMCSGSIF